MRSLHQVLLMFTGQDECHLHPHLLHQHPGVNSGEPAPPVHNDSAQEAQLLTEQAVHRTRHGLNFPILDWSCGQQS